ncbi:cytochrome B [Hahella sp. CCB-MM4]|uniref:cytochrome b n=1 Tax=Hahella sp. (strain CCB-MM4) TaxID=1926491 RepID=UPI000B9C0336|nr:cytochrome b [Hahella sp. CCB-MM4]OZG70600.1 cytochrome B [Hahella sp. CCB-MM4]
MIKNSSKGYGWLTILIHWIFALAVFGLFGLGVYMVELSYYDPWYHDAPEIHKSIGMILIFLIAFRLIWRWFNPRPEALSSLSSMEKHASEWAHRGLYLIIVVTLLVGYVIPTAEGRAVSVFGWFEVPALFPTIDGMADIAGEIHEWMAWTLVILAVVHGLAALKHHFIDKDKTLVRMLRPEK